MRTLELNKQKIYYANFLGWTPKLDSKGYKTGEKIQVYGTPSVLWVNVSASVGEDSVQPFGSFTDYSKTLVLTDNPLQEKARIWYDCEPNEDASNFNYYVTKVAKSLNSTIVGITENAK